MITKLTEQIISIIENKINDNNIDLSIRKIIKYFEDKGKKEIISEFEKYYEEKFSHDIWFCVK